MVRIMCLLLFLIATVLALLPSMPLPLAIFSTFAASVSFVGMVMGDK